MKGLKEIKIETKTEAIFVFETCEMHCDYVADWREREWTEAWTDPVCYPKFYRKEIRRVDIEEFYINGSEIKWYLKKHQQFEGMLFRELEKQNVH